MFSLNPSSVPRLKAGLRYLATLRGGDGAFLPDASAVPFCDFHFSSFLVYLDSRTAPATNCVPGRALKRAMVSEMEVSRHAG